MESFHSRGGFPPGCLSLSHLSTSILMWAYIRCDFLPGYLHESVFVHFTSNGRQVVIAGGRASACFRAAPCQHGDLGAEVVAAASHRRVLVFGVRAHVSLQVPPPPLPLDLPLDLRNNIRNRLSPTGLWKQMLADDLWITVTIWVIIGSPTLWNSLFSNDTGRGGQCVPGTIPWGRWSDAFYTEQKKNSVVCMATKHVRQWRDKRGNTEAPQKSYRTKNADFTLL